MDRRTFLGLLGNAGLVALVGCSDNLKQNKQQKKDNHSRNPNVGGDETKGTGKYVQFPSGLELEIIEDKRLAGRRKEFYDPNHSGNPLLKVRSSDLEEYVSDHFKIKEFAVVRNSSIMPSQYKQSHQNQTYFKYIRLDPQLVKMLEEAREETNTPLTINSGYRSYGYNIRNYQKNGKRIIYNSRHVSGDAVDIKLPDGHKARTILSKLFRQDGIGDGNSFIHVDNRDKRARWGYGRAPNGPEALCLSDKPLLDVGRNFVKDLIGGYK